MANLPDLGLTNGFKGEAIEGGCVAGGLQSGTGSDNTTIGGALGVGEGLVGGTDGSAREGSSHGGRHGDSRGRL